ncbi:efflux RND transporter periplasmic adaptor subunit [Geotalea uraniireducens]|uniref:Efflux transporter, RND family, MFP subunit n=1 Tax=Geotalea uraniireducens (strain Rf4) TaxID=351605 RepID=A5G433_GEOUR|nr:efflux RND transporter periplasmic adaptor subunit [Geotalea uraniireducens]ABQ26551.1 efflux transporter, RND family, MFP subunit [Geotalea uraniireducens Rf4]
MNYTTGLHQLSIHISKIALTGAKFALLLPIIMFLLPGCSKKQEKPRPKPPVPVKVSTAVQKDVPVQVKAIGNVEAYNTVSIKAQVNGQIARVHFREGQEVKKGDLLITIDPRPFETALKQAQANLLKDQAQARNADEQVRRYGGLVKDGIVTREQYDQLKTSADAFAATLASDQAAVESAKIQLAYCFIRSPINGRTGNLMVQQGNLVKANDVPVLVTINQINPVYVTFSVPENDLLEIKKYMAGGRLKVAAAIPNDVRPPETGTISFLDNMVDSTTGTIKLKGTFVNAERRLWPGQFVNVIVVLTTRPDSVVVPTQAIQTGQQGPFVFVVKADKSVELRQVTVGTALNGETVIEKGVQSGETVVIDGQLRLMPGVKIEIKQPEQGNKVKTQPAG